MGCRWGLMPLSDQLGSGLIEKTSKPVPRWQRLVDGQVVGSCLFLKSFGCGGLGKGGVLPEFVL